ncbi:LysE family translocator [Rhizobium sp. C1]|uniref:LysE family translocator n=1 Tax=Rhizobium sp. C1 TaxID=1349799 RepID=UPI001E5C5473|nr:LysE family translocator [Rhizobium sp. C1]MCD2176881.1 LysE family translocator [Rhizobium sp. C1]
MTLSTLLAFALTFIVFAASPGPDNFTIFTRTLSDGLRAGAAYGLGTVTGILVFLTLGLAGLSYAAEALAPYMVFIRTAGAAYLIWMGAALWFSAPPAGAPSAERVSPSRGSLFKTYATGVALNIGNPKMPLFYLAILPNVATSGITFTSYVELVAIILAVEVLVVGFYAGLALKARALTASTTVLRRMNKAAGAIMAATGVAILSNR